MTIAIIDNNYKDLALLEAAAIEAFPGSSVVKFFDPLLLVKFCINNPVELICTSETMRRMTCTDIVHSVAALCPSSLVCILSSGEAKRRADCSNVWWVQKPATGDKLRGALPVMSA